MDIEKNYLDLILQPLDGGNVLTVTEYLNEIKGLGVKIFDSKNLVDKKFETHFKLLCSKRKIVNYEGSSDPNTLGFIFTLSGHLNTVSHLQVMKAEKAVSTSTFNFNGPVTNQQAQFGNGNAQNVTINIQELVEKVAASNDPKAKGMLMKLLENPTVSGVIGAGVTGLIGLLG